MPVKTEAELVDLAQRALVEAGASATNAAIVAAHLVLANLSGVDTHGVWHLPGYVSALRDGLIDGTASPTLLTEGPNHALVSGNWTFGQVAAQFAMARAIEMACERMVAVVGLVQAHHIGRLGHYTEMAADEGCVAQVWAGGYSEEVPAAAPYGGRARLLHTNPLSMAFPGGVEPRMMFDFATTALSGVKIEEARRKGISLPPNAIVDREGRPTTDPQAFFDGGAHIPFGGHKGYGLSMAAEFYGRMFTGSAEYVDPKRGGPIFRTQGVVLILTRADLFRPLDDYRRDVDDMERRTRAVPPAPGFTEVLVPGDPEWRSRTRRRSDGIPVDDATWARIEALAH